MKHKHDKSQKVWVAILAFCLLVFIAIDCIWIYFSVIERFEPRKIIRGSLVCLVLTWISFNALRRRMSKAAH